MERLQKLELFNPLTYRREETGFNALIRTMLSAPVGTDSFIRYDFTFSDAGAVFSYRDSGMKTPLSDGEKKRIESGLSPLVRDDEDTAIPSGRYAFEQYPDLSEESMLTMTLAGIIGFSGAQNTVYVRLYKENALELVMQAFRPLLEN